MGNLYSMDRFVELVREGCFIDYDGCGDILDGDNNIIGHVRCDVEWLRRFKKQHPEAVKIRWFNR